MKGVKKFKRWEEQARVNGQDEKVNIRFEAPGNVVGVLVGRSVDVATGLNLVNDLAGVGFGFLGCVCRLTKFSEALLI